MCILGLRRPIWLVGWLAFLVCFLFFHFYLRLVSPSLPSYSGETKLATSNVTLFPHFSLGHAIFLVPKFCHTGLLGVDGCSTQLWLHPRQVSPIIQIAVDPIYSHGLQDWNEIPLPPSPPHIDTAQNLEWKKHGWPYVDWDMTAFACTQDTHWRVSRLAGKAKLCSGHWTPLIVSPMRTIFISLISPSLPQPNI